MPPSVVTKITCCVPFAIIAGTATSDFCVTACFRANTLKLAAVVTGQVPTGTDSLLAYMTASGPQNVSGATNGAYLYFKDAAVPMANRKALISTNYYHMGNMFQRYRVLSTTLTVSAENMMFQNSTGANRCTAHGVFNLFATPDIETADSVPEMISNWSRPALFGQRHAKTHTMHNQYTSPSNIRHTCSTKSLVRNVYPATTEEWSGACGAGASGGLPFYDDPVKHIWHGFTFHPYGASGDTNPRLNFLPSSTLLSGYMTVSYKCLFTDPHANSDFVNPL